jgi:hypothetical protein
MEVSTFGIWWRVMLTWVIWTAGIETLWSKPQFWLDVQPFFAVLGIVWVTNSVVLRIWRGIGATFEYVSKDA